MLIFIILYKGAIMTLAKNIFFGLVLVGGLSLGAGASQGSTAHRSFQLRCGWFSNPTPGNITLHDRDGVWVISAQGGYQTPGDWDWPEFDKAQWVSPGGRDYGYGCACIKSKVDPTTGHVLEIKSVRPLKLRQCRGDKTLIKKWSEKTFR